MLLLNKLLWTLFACLLIAFMGVRAAADEAPLPLVAPAVPLDAFVAAPEPEFSWRVVNHIRRGGAKVFRLELTSQRWQNNLWQHSLMVYEPADVKIADHMLLFITGGSTGNQPNESEVGMGVSLARLCGARVAVLHQVPNQPLMGNRYEDDLITETWLRYLATGDTSWPLLFPMAKSAVKAMDALEQFAASQSWNSLNGFVVAGASKRGWTSWLAAVADRRIKATAPMVIDMLNFSAQIKHQHALWGKPSEQVVDYTSKGLIREDGVPRPGRESNLWEMMDPFSYRQRLNMPKLLLVGANDRYWSTDAMNLYWDQLVGDKYIFRAANAGHGLEGKRDQALSTLAVFFRHVATDKPLPSLTWKPRLGSVSLGISIEADHQPESAKLWVARSDSSDFRDSNWESTAMQLVDGQWTGEEPVEGSRHVAVFGELIFKHDGLPYSLATLVYMR
jgi:PhoPQ-activated pathogenicity-related protein